MKDVSVFVGLDVSKSRLDIAVRPQEEAWSVANGEPGISEVVSRLQAVRPLLVVLEATGGMEVPVVAALAAVGLPVVVNPRQVRDFAKATGQLAKTDALGAGVLAWFGEAVKPVRAVAGSWRAGMAGLVDAPAATGGDADGRAEPAGACASRYSPRYSGAHPLAQALPEGHQ